MLKGAACGLGALLVLALGPFRPVAALVQRGSGSPVVAPDLAVSNRSDDQSERPRYKLFCFSWVHITDASRGHWEQKNLGWFEQTIKDCDGWALFSNKGWWSDPITVLPVHEGSWGHNMVQLMRCWDYLFKKADFAEYDWVLNIEADHIMRVAQVREMLPHHLRMIEDGMGTSMQPVHPRGAMMLEWGNVDLFNRAMVGEMRRQWWDLNRTFHRNATSEGCPLWKVGLTGWPACVQDVDYRLMARKVMVPPVPTYGTIRCNRPICSLNGMEDVDCEKGKLFVPCVSLNLPDKSKLQVLGDIGKRNMSVNSVVLRHVSGQEWSVVNNETPWLDRVDLRHTPFFHSVHSSEVYSKFRSSFSPVELFSA